MAAEIYHLDTHVVLWLGSKEEQHFLLPVVKLLENSRVTICPVVILEIQYLIERGRIKGHPKKIIDDLRKTVGLEICQDSFESLIEESLSLSWTRDPFDRLIVAQARLSQAPLLTRDHTIHEHYSKAVWENS